MRSGTGEWRMGKSVIGRHAGMNCLHETTLHQVTSIHTK